MIHHGHGGGAGKIKQNKQQIGKRADGAVEAALHGTECACAQMVFFGNGRFAAIGSAQAQGIGPCTERLAQVGRYGGKGIGHSVAEVEFFIGGGRAAVAGGQGAVGGVERADHGFFGQNAGENAH